MLSRWLLLTSLLIGLSLTPAIGKVLPGEEPRVCQAGFIPDKQTRENLREYDKFSVTEYWLAEAERYKDNQEHVWRRMSMLHLAVDGGKAIVLTDCPYGDSGYTYLYETYDQNGRFYVVQTPAYEDSYYSLVMRSTGKVFRIYGKPIWAPDKSKFLNMQCSSLPPVFSLWIHAPSGDGLAEEAEIEMPCDKAEAVPANCSAAWIDPSKISVTCPPSANSPRKDAEFTIVRSSEGTWKRVEKLDLVPAVPGLR